MKRWRLYRATYVNPDDPEIYGAFCSACWISRGRVAVQFSSLYDMHSDGVILYAFDASLVRLTDQWTHSVAVDA